MLHFPFFKRKWPFSTPQKFTFSGKSSTANEKSYV